MKNELTSVHFVDKYLLAPTNPVLVSLIGVGGTGSQVLTSLARINTSLNGLNHPGLQVQVFDDDVITPANLGRQLFAESEIGQAKAVALVSRINRFFGTNWKAIPTKVEGQNRVSLGNIIISCVDSVETRFNIAKTLKAASTNRYNRDRPMYWMDFGNSRDTGQVLLSTVSAIEQPVTKRYHAVARLPLATEEYKDLWSASDDNSEPSCSLAEALNKQDLFINTGIAALGCSLLWSMFREGMLPYRGFFMNLKQFRSQPIPVPKKVKKKQ